MSKVIKAQDDKFYVVRHYDGAVIAGPFADGGKAYEAQSETPSKVIRGAKGGGFVVVCENKGTKFGDFTSYEAALAEQNKKPVKKTLKAPVASE